MRGPYDKSVTGTSLFLSCVYRNINREMVAEEWARAIKPTRREGEIETHKETNQENHKNHGCKNCLGAYLGA